MQGNLKDAMTYAAKNPSSDFARQLKTRIESGQADDEASSLGLDLSTFGRPYKPLINTNLPKPQMGQVDEPKPDPSASIHGGAAGQLPGTFEKATREAAQAGVKTASSGLDLMDKAQNPYEAYKGAVTFGSGVGDTASAPIAGGVKAIAEKAGNDPFMQKLATSGLADKLFGGMENAQKAVESNPALKDALDTISKTLSIGAWGVGGPAAGEAGALAKTGIEATGQAAKSAVVATGKSVGNVGKDVVTAAGQIKNKIPGTKILQEPLPKSYENVLKETPAQTFDEMVAKGKGATESFKNMTPMEHVGERSVKALDIVQKQLDSAGKAKQDLMNIGTAGLTPVKKDIISKFNEGIQSLKNNSTLVDSDAKLVQRITNAIREFKDSPVLTANRVDKFIDQMQDELYTAGRNLSIPVTDRVTGRLQSLIGKLNEGLKEQLPPRYREMNQTYHDLIKVRNELNTKLGKEGERAGALMKRVFSPSDNNTKQLFQKVKDLTGIDLVNEATLARFVMDTVGDARQKSMLEQLDLPKASPSGVGNWLFKKLNEHVNSPDKMIERARELTQGGAPKKPEYNSSMGLAMKKDTSVGANPADVAQKINGNDIPLIQDFVEKPSLDNMMKLAPILEGMGVENLEPKMLQRFLQDVITERNTPEGGGVVEGKSSEGAAPSQDSAMETVDNHLISARQVVDNMSPAELRQKGGLPAIINDAKNEIVLSLKKDFPEAAPAIEKLDGDGYASIDAFEKDVKKALEQPRDGKGRFGTNMVQKLMASADSHDRIPQSVYEEYIKYPQKNIKVDDIMGLDHQGLMLDAEKPGRKVEVPILVKQNLDGTYVLVDGNHRMTQAIVNKDVEIPAFVKPVSND